LSFVDNSWFNQQGIERAGRLSEKIRILLVDDHSEVLQGLRKLLTQEEDMEIVGQCANGKEALISAAVLSPDIILMDVRMPIIDGLEATHLLSKKGVSCKVIILSMFEEYLDEAMKSGAQGYLIKGIKQRELAQAIRSVHHGEIVIYQTLAQSSN